MTYRQTDSPNISLTLNSLDDPDAVRPEVGIATERKAQWLRDLDSLPKEAWDLTDSPGFVSHQAS